EHLGICLEPWQWLEIAFDVDKIVRPGSGLPGLVVELAVDRDRLSRPMRDMALGGEERRVGSRPPTRRSLGVGLELLGFAWWCDGKVNTDSIFPFQSVGDAKGWSVRIRLAKEGEHLRIFGPLQLVVNDVVLVIDVDRAEQLALGRGVNDHEIL